MKHAPDLRQAPLSLMAAADLQNHLIVACNDLDRLQVLLADACDVLMDSFRGALEHLNEHQRTDPDGSLSAALGPAQAKLADAVSALQFQDMTSQLIQHTERRLRNCADRIACETMKDEDGEAIVEPAPLRSNPVTQAEMDVGSIDLF
jgi:hypothetical protein